MNETGANNWLTRLTRTLLGLQCKATVLVVALLVMLAGSLCVVSVRHAWALTTRLDRERTSREADRISRLAAPLQAATDQDGVRYLLNEFMKGGQFLFLSITDTQGGQIASAGRAELVTKESLIGNNQRRSPIGLPIARRIHGTDEQYFDVVFPIAERADKRKPKLLGYLRLGLSRNHTIAEFDAAADLVAGIALAIVLVAIPLGFLVVRTIVVPLEEMSRVAQRFSAGDVSARCKFKRTDEIGVLASDLNEMADEVVRKHDEITKLNEELEQRVSERTAQLRELASRDPLTSLYNRRHIGEVLTRRFSEAKRYKNNLSVMMIDMDDFKTVNDSFGHPIGDQVLTLIADTIISQLRSSDVAARFGGDEFIVVLPQSSSDHAELLGERVQGEFRRRIKEQLPQVASSISVGIASLVGSDFATDADFIRAADRALYEAKELGRNRIIVASICNKEASGSEYQPSEASAPPDGSYRPTV